VEGIVLQVDEKIQRSFDSVREDDGDDDHDDGDDHD